MHHRGALTQIPEASTAFLLTPLRQQPAEPTASAKRAGAAAKKGKKSRKGTTSKPEEDAARSATTALAAQWWEHAVSGGHAAAAYGLAQLLEASPSIMPQLLQLRKTNSSSTSQETIGNETAGVTSPSEAEASAEPTTTATETAVEQEVLRLYGVAAAGGVAGGMHALGIAYHQVRCEEKL